MTIRRRLPVLSSLRAFEAAGRHLNFSRAAEELLISQSAVSHHIRKLEDELGVALFVRQARSVTLTSEGARYLACLSEAFDQIANGTEAIRVAERRTLRLSLLASFATHWLIPRLSRFTKAHPEIELILEPSIRPVDFAVDQIDLAIRYGRGEWPGAKSQPFVSEQISPVCSPDYLTNGAGLRQPSDLLKHTLLFSFSKEPFEWRVWSERAGLDLTNARTLMLHDYNIVLQAAVDGQGVAMGRRTIIASHLARGLLVEPFKEITAQGMGYWIVMPTNPKPQAKAFAQWLAAEASCTMHEQRS